MKASFLDESGREQPVVMGSYGIGVGRLLACIAEEHHDDKGLRWPASVAPFPVHLVSLNGNPDVQGAADRVYASLTQAGIEALYDDREDSPGVKFADADLIGLPIRVTVSKRSLEAGGVEVKARTSDSKEIVAEDALPETVRRMLGARDGGAG